MRGLKNLMWVQFKLYLREPAAFFFTLAFPALCLLLFGAIYGNEPAPAFWGRPVGTVNASVPAYIGLSGLLGGWYWLTVIRRSPTPAGYRGGRDRLPAEGHTAR